MAETKVPGGVYEDAPDAGTYHDANGNPVTKDGAPMSKEAGIKATDRAADRAAHAEPKAPKVKKGKKK